MYNSIHKLLKQYMNNMTMMRRSCGSLTSLTSHSSINSQTKIFNTRDFKNYIANMEEDIIKVSNDYYHYADRYDKKINNIYNRYEERTNKLFIDLRYREAECKRLNNKLDYLFREFKMNKNITGNSSIYCDPVVHGVHGVDGVHGVHVADASGGIEKYILCMLYMYTIFVISMVITY